jgi:hypothetical protein
MTGTIANAKQELHDHYRSPYLLGGLKRKAAGCVSGLDAPAGFPAAFGYMVWSGVVLLPGHMALLTFVVTAKVW